MKPSPAPDGLASLCYNALVSLAPLAQRPRLGRGWWKLWRGGLSRLSGPVRTTIHGRRAVVNFGNTYPVNTRLFPHLNDPLVELVHQCFKAGGRPVTFVDVGAATGDTILLLFANCPGMIRRFYCVDGDREFFEYLQQNVGHFPEGELIFTLLSASGGDMKDVIRTHGGTASAQGEATARSSTLDAVLRRPGVEPPDVLKIDVDGFDGQVLLGAVETLAEHRPAVIFEWHPILCRQTGNNWTDHFDALGRAGYDRFIWFDKFGEFSHLASRPEPQALDRLAEFCLSSKSFPDLHYDVVALPPDSRLADADLADAAFARNRRSRR